MKSNLVRLASVGTGLLGAAAAAHAELPAGVSSAIDGAKADGATVGGMILAAIIIIFAFKLIRRAL